MMIMRMIRGGMLLGVLLAAGCATAPAETETGTPAAAAYGDATGMTGTWRGSYVCGQGLTALELDLTGHADGRVEGIFAFSAHPDNPGVPSGSYHVRGRMSAGGVLSLRGGAWIEHPEPYVTVDLVGRAEGDPDRYYGFVDGPLCDTFLVER